MREQWNAGYPERYTLTQLESGLLQSKINELATVDLTSGEEGVEQFTLCAQELPRTLRSILNRFRLRLPQVGGLIVSGMPFGESSLGPTPSGWRAAAKLTSEMTRQADLTLLLLGALIGDVFSFGTQHGETMVIDVFPIKGDEQEQLGSASEADLEWHNEDAFHPFRADFLLLYCLRNTQEVATTFASCESLSIPGADRSLLSEEVFMIRPDESHVRRLADLGQKDLHRDRRLNDAYARMERMVNEPPRIAVLSGSIERPFIRVDPHFMDILNGDSNAARALSRLIDEIDSKLVDVVLRPGEVLLIDNRRAVHGRRSFKAFYDGNDRWLKRINVTSSLSRSILLRSDPQKPRMLL